ncbi:VanZ family protein [Paenibacillus faecis]|uniref:VanZ family protein n=1 Tax=Paenibacillus faecis TaxID=862114 RepID=UPI001B1F33D3|nr:VanZ family protein [Paenibacillus faecis]GIO86608.1 VanZ family protein [Paenibacillus faecis]
MPFRKLYRWIPAVMIMTLLFMFSSQPYQQQSLKTDIEKSITQHSVKERLSGFSFTYAGHEVSIQSLGIGGFIEFFIRKAAHFSIYGLLGMFVLYALNSGRRGRDFTLAVFISFLYACSDELHQAFTPDRTPMVQDVLLDTAGAVCGALVLILLWRWRAGRKLVHKRGKGPLDNGRKEGGPSRASESR